MPRSVFALVTKDEQAQRIVDHLLSSGFSNADISILSPDHRQEKIRTNASGEVEYVEFNERTKRGTLATEKHTKAPEGGVTGAATGGILGGSIGLLAGIGALAIPGVGPFIAAGPIIAALSGSAIGGGLGLLIGALIGAGLPEFEAKKYEEGLKAGGILISVRATNDEEIKRASEIFKKDGAKDISTSREKARSY